MTNNNPIPQKEYPGKEQTVSEGVQESIYPHQYELNIADGGEFLDDGIRMKDQPFQEKPAKEVE
jgi:hypothetical protein